MKLTELAESDLLSFRVDYQNLYIEFVILTDKQQKIKVLASNTDTTPISVNFKGLRIRSDLTTIDNVPSLGEIESVNESRLGFSFEGDMGFIGVKANHCRIEKSL